MTTIKDVALTAQVSIITISRYFNNPEKVSVKTKLKIEKAISALDYHPNEVARSLVKRKTNVLGVVMPDIKNTFFNSWFRAAENYARHFDYNMLLCNTDEDPDLELKYLRLLISQRADGIILVPTAKKSVQFLEKNNIKYILVDRFYNDIDSDYIATDHYSGSYELVEYLIKNGHRKISVLKGDGTIYSGMERYRAFKDVMRKHKIKIDSSLVHNCQFKQQEAFEATMELLKKKDKPTVIYTFNSLMAIGAIKAIRNVGLKIPQDISLVCFDELPGQEIFEPEISCVLQPVEALGRSATMFLLDKINSKENLQTQKVSLKPTLQVGSSCLTIN